MNTLVIGHTTHDHYQGGFVAGGCAYYGARVHDFLSRQNPGEKTRLLTLVGESFQCADELQGLDVTLLRQGATTVFANYYPPSGPRIQLLEALAPPISPADFPAPHFQPHLLHLAPVLGELDLLAWKEAFPDAKIAINVQGWIKKAGPEVDSSKLEAAQARGIAPRARSVIQSPWEITARELQGVHIACLSDEDLIDQGDLLDRLLQAVPIVALTHGSKGSTIFVDKKPARVGIHPSDPLDPTGAGDVFAAAFSHQIAACLDPLQAARFAAAASSIVIEENGAAALSRLHEIQARAAKVPLL